MTDTIEKVSIVISKGSLEGIYPGLIMANGARAEGMEANLLVRLVRSVRMFPREAVRIVRPRSAAHGSKNFL